MSRIRFYLDENVPIDIENQLLRRSIECVSARGLGTLGDTDENHLARATAMRCVLCTHDRDLLRMHAQGVSHAGIAFAPHQMPDVGRWVRQLVALWETETPESIANRVIYLKSP